MANPGTITYENSKLITEKSITRADVLLAADTYYIGMPLSFESVVAADESNTGDGTLSQLNNKAIKSTITVEMTDALVAKVTVNSVDVITGIALPDGGSVVIIYDGVELLLTDGATPFVSGDKFTVTFDSGAFAYNATDPQAFYNGEDARVLSSEGQGCIVDGGEVLGADIVDDSGSALTITEGFKQAAKNNGLYVK